MAYRSPRYARIVAGLALLFVAEAQAQEPAPPTAGVKKLATEVYVYAYPLVLMDVTRMGVERRDAMLPQGRENEHQAVAVGRARVNS